MNIKIVVPSTVLFVAFDATFDPFQMTISDFDSCPEFARWQQLIKCDISIDFRRLLRIDSGFGSLNDYQIDLSVFEERRVLGGIEAILREVYERCDDGSSVIVKRISGIDSKESLLIEIENGFNLFHPCIFVPIGFIFGGESSLSRELNIVELYCERNLLSEVNSTNPVWWTATAKAKAVAGIVLSLRFAHSHGLIHGHLSSKNIIFDMDHRIEITEFCRIGDKVGRREEGRRGFLNEEWSPDPDILSFVSILFEIIVGHPEMLSESVNTEEIAFKDIPKFVSNLITSIQSPVRPIGRSFNDIFMVLKDHNFEILSGVDSVDVIAFVDWIESIEELVK
jgi:hypothetical protein